MPPVLKTIGKIAFFPLTLVKMGLEKVTGRKINNAAFYGGSIAALAAGIAIHNAHENAPPNPNAPVVAPVTDFLPSGYYRTTVDDAGFYQSSSGQPSLQETFDSKRCVLVGANMAGYEFAAVRIPAPTHSGFTTGYMKKAELRADAGCATLTREFDQQASSAPRYARTNVMLTEEAYLYATSDAGPQRSIAQVAPNTCVTLEDEIPGERMQKISVRVGNQTVTGWGQLSLDRGQACTPANQ